MLYIKFIQLKIKELLLTITLVSEYKWRQEKISLNLICKPSIDKNLLSDQSLVGKEIDLQQIN